MKGYIAVLLFLGLFILGAYEALIYYDDNFRYGRMRETPAVRPQEEKVPAMEAGVVPVTGGEAKFRNTDGRELISPLVKGDHTSWEEGKVLYFKYCAQCHGRFHDGNGTVGQSFHPLPTDLRMEKVQSMVDGVFFKEISYGVPDGRQPPLATTIEILDRWKIIAYLKSLGTRQAHQR